MTRGPKIVKGVCAAALAGVALAACGGSTAPAKSAGFVSAQLRAFQLAQVGAPHSADGRDWQQYGARPVGQTLTINPMTLYDAGTTPVVLLGIRQAHPQAGLTFNAQLVTLTPGFDAYSEFVSRGQPASAFGAHANFSPLRGFELSPNPKAQMAGFSPTVVLTVTARRPGMFHIGNWVVTYRVGDATRTLELVDHGVFCVGTRGCPSL